MFGWKSVHSRIQYDIMTVIHCQLPLVHFVCRVFWDLYVPISTGCWHLLFISICCGISHSWTCDPLEY